MFDDKFTESKIFPTFHDRIKEGSRLGGPGLETNGSQLVTDY